MDFGDRQRHTQCEEVDSGGSRRRHGDVGVDYQKYGESRDRRRRDAESFDIARKSAASERRSSSEEGEVGRKARSSSRTHTEQQDDTYVHRRSRYRDEDAHNDGNFGSNGQRRSYGSGGRGYNAEGLADAVAAERGFHINSSRNAGERSRRDHRDSPAAEHDYDYHQRNHNGRRYEERYRDDGSADDYRSYDDYDDGGARHRRRRNNEDSDYTAPHHDQQSSLNTRWKQEIPTATAMVKMLPSHVDEQHLRQLLGNEWRQRALVRVPRPLDGGGGQNRGFGFIEFPTIADASQWLEQHDGVLFIDDTRCPISYCHAKQHGAPTAWTAAPTSAVSTGGDVEQPSQSVACETNATSAGSGTGWACESCSAYNYAYRYSCFRCKRSGGNAVPSHATAFVSRNATSASAAAADDDPGHQQELYIARQLASDPRKLIRLNDNTDTLLLRHLNPISTDETVRLAIQNFISSVSSGTLIFITGVKVIHAVNDALHNAAGSHNTAERSALHRKDSGGGTWSEQKHVFSDNDNNSGCYCFVQLKSVEQAQALHRHSFRTPLEIDNFRVTVVYAAISLSATFPTASSVIPASARTQHPAIMQSDMANAAAATAQAALARFQQQKKLADGGNSNGAASGTVDPDCVFDAVSGYYFYKSSGLYYHPDTQLFYNPQTQKYLYYDVATHQYMPHESSGGSQQQQEAAGKAADSDNTDEDDKARAQRVAREMEQWAKKQTQLQSSVVNSVKPRAAITVTPQPPSGLAASEQATTTVGRNNAVPVSSLPQKQAALQPISSTRPYFDAGGDDEKPTVVHDIDSMLSTTVAASNMPKIRYGNAAGDAGCYGPRKYMSRKRDQFGIPVASEGHRESSRLSPGLQPATTTATPVLPSTFADYNGQICTLCGRQFKSADVLDKHIAQSALHKENLEAFLAKQHLEQNRATARVRETASGTSVNSSTTYRDRAAERRLVTGAVDEPPLLDDRKYHHTAMLREAYYSAASAATVPNPSSKKKAEHDDKPIALGNDNVGHKMLKKMNWQEGKGLGARQQGIVDPLEARARTGRRGLDTISAARDEGLIYDASDSYAERLRKLAQHRYKELGEKDV